MDLCRDESFRSRILKIFPQRVVFLKKAVFDKIANDFWPQAAISAKWLQIAETYDQLSPLRDVDFPFLLLESTQSHSRGLYSVHIESTLSQKTLFYGVL